jgi:site-specific recombinase XerD
MNLLECEKKFLIRCNVKCLQVSSIELYKTEINRFIKFANRLDVFSIEQVTSDIISEYLVTKGKTCSKVTLQGDYTRLRCFFNFLYRSCIIPTNPISAIEKPKAPKRLIKAFTQKDVRTILTSFDKNTFTGYRNYTVMCMLFGTGMRRSELVNLKIADIYLELDIIKVIGKGDKERNIPIGQVLKKVMMKYLKMRNDYMQAKNIYQSPYFIVTYMGKKFSPVSINVMFDSLKKSNLFDSKKVSPHIFRHTFAKFFLLNGGDVFTLQQILGHSDIDITRQYVYLNEREIKAQNEKFNPLDNTRWQYY